MVAFCAMAPEIGVKTTAEVVDGLFDFTNKLRDGELLTAIAVVQEEVTPSTASALTIGNERVTEELVTKQDGDTVGIGKGGFATISGGDADAVYVLKATATSDASPTNHTLIVRARLRITE